MSYKQLYSENQIKELEKNPNALRAFSSIYFLSTLIQTQEQ
ncbi:hypothetical protein [Peribacillus deserti]|nr:hypothetical protein [Peribacillus deserti]